MRNSNFQCYSRDVVQGGIHPVCVSVEVCEIQTFNVILGGTSFSGRIHPSQSFTHDIRMRMRPGFDSQRLHVFWPQFWPQSMISALVRKIFGSTHFFASNGPRSCSIPLQKSLPDDAT
jgi:hypothetical protein